MNACYHRASAPSWRSVRGPSSPLTLVVTATGLACWLLVASPVFAQSSTPDPPATWPGVLTGARFLVGSEFLNDDARDLRLGVVSGAALDLVDYRVGRLLVAFDFAGVLDDDWNPTHLDYGLEFSPTYRARFAEVAFVYHHTSRHLHDRARPEPVFYNLAGFRVSRAWRRDARLHGETAAEGLFYFPGWQSGVDYRWEAGGAGRLVYDQSPRWGYYGSGRVRWLGTEPTEYGRARVSGVRIEAGVRAGYGAGRLEAFVGFDRRVDPAPLVHEAVSLFVLGARLVR